MELGELKAYCPFCGREQTFTYRVLLKDIYGGDYDYGYEPYCTVEVEWICEEGFVIETKEFEL